MDVKLYQAVISGDIDFLQNLKIEERNNNIIFQVTSQLKNNILHLATNFKQKKIAETIITLYPSLLYHTNFKGDTPVHIAARLGATDILEVIIRRKTCIVGHQQLLKMVNIEKNTALHDAVKNGHLGIVKLLIEADPELACCINDYGESPLFLAVDRRFFDIGHHILLCVPTCSYHGRNNMNALHAAIIRTSNGNHITSLIDLWVQNNSYPSRFSYVALTSVEPTWKRLKELFCDTLKAKLFSTGLHIETDVMAQIIRLWPNATTEADDFGWTPLHYAAHFGHTKAVKMLLMINDNMHIAYMKDKQGMSALHIAAKEGHFGVMKQLITFCPETCEFLDKRNRTPLHVAVESGKADSVKYILKTHAFEGLLNEQDCEGNTSLHSAAVRGYRDIINMLVDDDRVEKGSMNKAGLVPFEIILSNKELRHFQKALITKKLAKCHGDPSLKRVVHRGITKSQVFEMNEEAQHNEDITEAFRRENEVEANEAIIDGRSKYDSISKRVKRVANAHLLVATIIATVTFTAGFQMPGGLDRGMAISSRKLAFRAFLISDAIAFYCSATSMLLHFWASNEQNSGVYLYFMRFASALTYNSMIAMVAAFISGTNVVLDESSWLGIVNLVIGCCFFSVFSVWFFR